MKISIYRRGRDSHLSAAPSRERREDIPLLVDAFISRIRLKSRKNIVGMAEEALEQLVDYDWPGNIRELINAIEYAFVLCSGEEIQKNHFPPSINGKSRYPSEQRLKRDHRVDSDSKKVLLEALKKTNGNKSEAAKSLGISRVTLWKRLKAHDIQVSRAISG